MLNQWLYLCEFRYQNVCGAVIRFQSSPTTCMWLGWFSPHHFLTSLTFAGGSCTLLRTQQDALAFWQLTQYLGCVSLSLWIPLELVEYLQPVMVNYLKQSTGLTSQNEACLVTCLLTHFYPSNSSHLMDFCVDMLSCSLNSRSFLSQKLVLISDEKRCDGLIVLFLRLL